MKKGKHFYSKQRSHHSRTEGESFCNRVNPAEAGNCSRFCSNVCRTLFPLDFNRCFNDCLSCKNGVVYATDEEYLTDEE